MITVKRQPGCDSKTLSFTVETKMAPPAWLLTLLLLLSTQANAINYDVELIIFEHARRTSVGAADQLLVPVVEAAQTIPLNATPLEDALQPLPQLRLLAEAEKLAASNNFRVLYHGGWRQPDYSEENAPFIRFDLGQQLLMYTERSAKQDPSYLPAYLAPPLQADLGYREAYSHKLSGGIRVWVGRFLHLDTRLAYTPTESSRSYPFESERRMRSRQLNYIDHSRIGILAKIFPVDETAAN